MKKQFNRRHFLAASGAASVIAAPAAFAAPAGGAPLKILGISCSPRKGMTTAAAVQAALDAAKGVDPRIETELIDLGGLSIAGWSPAPPDDDFAALLPKLRDPAVAGLVIGSPSYFRGCSSLCKAFIERCGALREPEMLLDGKPVGAIAVGGFRNGGQELVIGEIHTAMMCFGMVPVGGRPPAFMGGTLVSADNRIDEDELGLTTARNTGARVADFARRTAKAAGKD